MQKFKFVVSDETINSHGCIVRTAGINTAKFERNPVMWYMHDRDQGIIGRWENLHKEGDKLIAEAVFDEGVELGAKVKHQVESGFIRSASIGVDNVRYDEIDGVNTIVECELYEISIVDIPANENAVKLFFNGRPMKRLSKSKKQEDNNRNSNEKTLRSRIIEALRLTEEATDDDVISFVTELIEKHSGVEKEVDAAISCGLIQKADRKSFCTMAKADMSAFQSYCESRKRLAKDEIRKMLESTRKVLPQEREWFEKVGEQMGVEVLRGILDSVPEPIRLSRLIQTGNNREGWTLKDYRTYDPEALKDDPKLYKRLIEKETGRKYVGKDLDYYRRHEPERLAKDPELYAQLIEKQYNIK